MSIVLKTDPQQLAPWAHITASQHDALAAHAMQMAIEELEPYIAAWINERAAANLARLMGEGSQTSRKCPMDGTCCSHSDCATKCQEHST